MKTIDLLNIVVLSNILNIDSIQTLWQVIKENQTPADEDEPAKTLLKLIKEKQTKEGDAK